MRFISPLSSKSGAFKVKPNKIVVTLKKPKDSKFKWYDLKK